MHAVEILMCNFICIANRGKQTIRLEYYQIHAHFIWIFLVTVLVELCVLEAALLLQYEARYLFGEGTLATLANIKWDVGRAEI